MVAYSGELPKLKSSFWGFLLKTLFSWFLHLSWLGFLFGFLVMLNAGVIFVGQYAVGVMGLGYFSCLII